MTNIVVTPSRFDIANRRLLCSQAGQWLTGLVRDRSFNVLSYKDVHKAPPADHWILAGRDAILHTIGNRIEGYRVPFRQGCAMPTYDAQLANDFYAEEADADNEHIESDKDRAATARSNYRHWILIHVDKLYNPRPTEPQPRFNIKPNLSECLNKLSSGSHVYLDIETDPDTDTLLCIGLSSDDGEIFCVPVYDYRGSLFYSDWVGFWEKLNAICYDKTLVIHNSMFDLGILCKFYNFYGVRKVYDTMIAQHRIFPEAEKSLAHCIAHWTELPYHKDGFIVPCNPAQENQLYQYNCNDIWSMRLIHRAQLQYADKRTLDSINAGNRLIVPLLANSLDGIEVDSQKLSAVKLAVEAECRMLYEILTILLGYELNCGSPQQLGDYLYNKMGYKPPGRTATGAPATDKKALYRLSLTTQNPALAVIIRLKIMQKRRSMLEFESL